MRGCLANPDGIKQQYHSRAQEWLANCFVKTSVALVTTVVVSFESIDDFTQSIFDVIGIEVIANICHRKRRGRMCIRRCTNMAIEPNQKLRELTIDGTSSQRIGVARDGISADS